MHYTALATGCLAIWKALESESVDPAPLFRRAGLDPELMRNPNARYPIAATSALWREIVSATGA